MTTFIEDCPRCGTQKITFDALGDAIVSTRNGWQQVHETFCVCRNCSRTTVFRLGILSTVTNMLRDKLLTTAVEHVNPFVEMIDYISMKDAAAIAPPEHCPPDVENAFREAARCVAVGCYNAAAAMFRLGIDLATAPMLPTGTTPGLKHKTRRDLAIRMAWLFDTGRLPEALRELSESVRQDGNDGAHRGTLTKEDALDMQDFAEALFERLFTEPEKLKEAAQRRVARRTP